MSELFDFLNQSLRKDASFSIEDEYPSLFDPRFGGRSLIEKDQSGIISHAGYLIKNYSHPHFTCRIAMIGSVVTETSYRGRGYASSLVNQAIKKIRDEKVSLIVLWSDQEEFYRKLGFYRVGQEWDFLISEGNLSASSRSCRPINLAADLMGIWSLYLKHDYGLERSLEEMQAYLQIPELKCFVTERDGEIDSYICINKGADFTQVIHEWGGEVQAVCQNIQSCQKKYFANKPLVLISPASNEFSAFEKISMSRKIGHLGLVKVLDRKILIEQYLNWNRFSGEQRQEQEKKLGELDDEKFLKTCFGGGEMINEKPLPFFLWGFDSI